MDELFRNSSWFVPSHPPRVVDGVKVEEAIRQGKLQPGHATEFGAASAVESKGNSEEKLEHA